MLCHIDVIVSCKFCKKQLMSKQVLCFDEPGSSLDESNHKQSVDKSKLPTWQPSSETTWQSRVYKA